MGWQMSKTAVLAVGSKTYTVTQLNFEQMEDVNTQLKCMFMSDVLKHIPAALPSIERVKLLAECSLQSIAVHAFSPWGLSILNTPRGILAILWISCGRPGTLDAFSSEVYTAYQEHKTIAEFCVLGADLFRQVNTSDRKSEATSNSDGENPTRGGVVPSEK
jgi:hypothetical protein